MHALCVPARTKINQQEDYDKCNEIYDKDYLDDFENMLVFFVATPEEDDETNSIHTHLTVCLPKQERTSLDLEHEPFLLSTCPPEYMKKGKHTLEHHQLQFPKRLTAPDGQKQDPSQHIHMPMHMHTNMHMHSAIYLGPLKGKQIWNVAGAQRPAHGYTSIFNVVLKI